MFPQIPELIARHCLPLDPIDIRYRIVLDQEKFLSKTAWDIEVEVEETSRHRLHPLALGNTPAQQARAKDLKELDDKIGEAMAGLNSSRLKRSFMLAFAEDPAGFTNRWVESQAEDLKLMLGDGRYNPEELRHSEFFEKPEIEEAVAYYLNARMTGTVGTSRK